MVLRCWVRKGIILTRYHTRSSRPMDRLRPGSWLPLLCNRSNYFTNMKTFPLIIVLAILPAFLKAQGKICQIDLHHIESKPLPVSLPMRGTSPDGSTLSVNSLYFEKDGRPWF